MMNDFPTPEETCEKAAELLVRDGWCQHQSSDINGRRCAMGAIATATKELGFASAVIAQRLAASRRAAELLEQFLEDADAPEFLGDIPLWNDHPNRTAEDVILALKRAASGG